MYRIYSRYIQVLSTTLKETDQAQIIYIYIQYICVSICTCDTILIILLNVKILYDHLLSNLSKYILYTYIYIEKIQLPASMFNVYVKILPPAQFFKFSPSIGINTHTHPTHRQHVQTSSFCACVGTLSEPSINK